MVREENFDPVDGPGHRFHRVFVNPVKILRPGARPDPAGSVGQNGKDMTTKRLRRSEEAIGPALFRADQPITRCAHPNRLVPVFAHGHRGRRGPVASQLQGLKVGLAEPD